MGRHRRHPVRQPDVLAHRQRLLRQGSRNHAAVYAADGTAGTGTGGDDLRKSCGGIGQVTFTPANSKITVAGSWGISMLQNADAEADFKTKNWLASGGIYYQATKSLKAVAEFNYAVTGTTANERRQQVHRASRWPDAVLLRLDLLDGIDGLPSGRPSFFI